MTSMTDDYPFVFVDKERVRLFDLASKVAKSDVQVLITGPSGAGKEVLARVVHVRDAVDVVVLERLDGCRFSAQLLAHPWPDHGLLHVAYRFLLAALDFLLDHRMPP